MKNAEEFITAELEDLGINPDSEASHLIFFNALAASDIMTRQTLRKYIEEYADSLPHNLFH